MTIFSFNEKFRVLGFRFEFLVLSKLIIGIRQFIKQKWEVDDHSTV